MTAKEVIEEIYYNGTYNTGIKKRHYEILHQYARQACKEQRGICARQVSGWPDKIKTESEIEDDIINAPEPELE